MPFTKVKVLGTFKDAAGKVQNGRVEAMLSGCMQNEGVTVEPSIISGKITSGVLTGLELYANDDAGTLPTAPGIRVYTFKITIFGSPHVAQRQFVTWVPHTIPSINITELVERSGSLGLPAGGSKPVLPGNASLNQVLDALAFLQLVEVTSVPPGSPTYFQV